ncbi:hypothetical protein GCM10022209_55200 [Chitinophaga oryziterrae]
MLFFSEDAIGQAHTDTIRNGSVLHLKKQLNLSDEQYRYCLQIFQQTQQSIDSLNKVSNDVTLRDGMIRAISATFFQRMQSTLTAEQWQHFRGNAIRKRNEMKERAAAANVIVKELPEPDSSIIND